MVKLTTDLILKNTGQIRRQRDESLQHFTRRITHAYCNEKNIDEIENIAACRNLSVLYLYDNHIKNCNKLINLFNLTHLYLQNNNITKLPSLHSLKKLTKIYLGGNEIAVLEGLEKLPNVIELRIENQRLPPGEKLLFDPRSLATIRRSVQVLDISGNGLDNLADFYGFENLIYFTAKNNTISNFETLKRTFSSWFSTTTIDLTGNPICEKSRYRDQMLVICPSSVGK
ncbi:uncharacterized protein TRIADDRAFT_27741 [Trichoplax adhaerens]|uniref:Protein phosphatase 1 regulatory subunit 42 n=1 Tax=Trichoplax adhaerens TaxID=10228 RepID=B3S2D8_TRIAD|nr:hypothetical protein TRIADDRAFT_27741 [Trichoplax adhaerens]EDV23399.1 hypothetical protein TRIADDRAFT_27741 [Trichoplax adhaerens]|eukprot:XP_002114309.1 hypothetical protein TRIADDRAFT_27741 [Trichoplax adhaerens]